MKKLSIVTIFMFALGLYVVPATFATGTDSKDKKDRQTGQGDYQKDQIGQPQQKDKMGQPQAQQAQKGQQLGQTQNLLLVSHLIGSEIQNQQGEKIGDIDRVLVDLNNGQIGFVTVSSGGVLGMGEDKYIVPFNALQKKFSQGKDAQGIERKVVFTINKKIDQLKELPGGNIEEALTVESQSRGIHEHYGVSPYWEGNQRQLQRQDDTKTPMSKDQKHDPKMMDKKDNQKNMMSN